MALQALHIQVHGVLLDGSSTTVILSPERSCWDLLRALERSFGLGAIIGKLIVKGKPVSILTNTLRQQGIHHDDTVTCIKQCIRIFARCAAVVKVTPQGSMSVLRGPEPRHEDMQFCCIQSVAISGSAVAALTTSGTLITWGDSLAGGDSWSLQSQLRDRVRCVLLQLTELLLHC